jgi:hypothetical protein|tara:strand:- start:348 stop:725 length:378 start_codon:yes stop_codon:yes gene_type:complete
METKLPAPGLVSIVVVVFLLLAPSTTTPAASLLDRELSIDSELYDTLTGILESGKYKNKDVLIDLSELQTVQISEGRLKFTPPIEVSWKFIKSTITEMKATTDGRSIFVDVDNSPIDVNIVPRKS